MPYLESVSSEIHARGTLVVASGQSSYTVRTYATLHSHCMRSVHTVMRYVLRVWLADRPGSLGTLATRIGEVGADLVGIDILERDGARAVDELTVDVSDGLTAGLLVDAVGSLSGVDVEDVREIVSRSPHPASDVLDVAVSLTEGASCSELEAALVRGVCSVFSCDWAAAVDLPTGGPVIVATAGAPPAAEWLAVFVAGASAGQTMRSDGELAGPRDLAWASLGSAELIVVAGRDGPPFRSRERRQLQQLCRIADGRWRDLALASRRATHPAVTTKAGDGCLRLTREAAGVPEQPAWL